VAADRWLRLTGFVGGRWTTTRPAFLVHCTEEGKVADLLREPDNWFVTATDSNLEIMTWGTGTQTTEPDRTADRAADRAGQRCPRSAWMPR
jgi:hypothetical protein